MYINTQEIIADTVAGAIWLADRIVLGLACAGVVLVVAICVGAAVDIEFMRSLVNKD